jgi:SWI/SNF-related matrix-associated actin-dependent regulator of chromatin subfamily D
MAATITPYIVKPDPIVLFHPIDLSPPDASEPTNLTESQLHHKTMKIYDIEIDVEDTSKRTRIGALLTSFSPTTTTALSQVDDQLAQTAQALRNALLKKEFFDTFAEDPVGFIQTWIESQKEDLDMILGTEGGVREDELRRSEFFRMPWVEEAVAIHEGVRVVAALQVAQQQEMQVASSGGR